MSPTARITVRVGRAAALAGALSLSFLFVHRTVLGWGGSTAGRWQHEDFYGLPVFGAFF